MGFEPMAEWCEVHRHEAEEYVTLKWYTLHIPAQPELCYFVYTTVISGTKNSHI